MEKGKSDKDFSAFIKDFEIMLSLRVYCHCNGCCEELDLLERNTHMLTIWELNTTIVLSSALLKGSYIGDGEY